LFGVVNFTVIQKKKTL